MGKQSDQIKTLNAKKLDINFDNDDFFNSFEPVKKNQSESQALGGAAANAKFVSKLQEVDDPFDLVPKQKENKDNFFNVSNNTKGLHHNEKVHSFN